jgi:hypothetical protein
MAHDTTDNRSPDGIGADDPHSKKQSIDTTPTRPANATPGDESDTLDVDGLAALLHRRRSTILTDRSRNPDRVPPSCTPPGARYPLWIRTDVLAWLRRNPDPPRHRPHSGNPSRPRHPGRPTKAETVRRKRGRA